MPLPADELVQVRLEKLERLRNSGNFTNTILLIHIPAAMSALTPPRKLSGTSSRLNSQVRGSLKLTMSPLVGV